MTPFHMRQAKKVRDALSHASNERGFVWCVQNVHDTDSVVRLVKHALFPSAALNDVCVRVHLSMHGDLLMSFATGNSFPFAAPADP